MTTMPLLLLIVVVSCRLVDGALDLLDVVKLGSVKRAAALLAEGADVNATDTLGWTALHNAANMGQVELVNLLVYYHADLDTPEPHHGKTALHLAAYNGQEATIRTLLDAGASVDVTDVNGQTALHLAAWHGHLEVILALLEYGANVDIQDRLGSTPVFLATIQNFDQEVKELLTFCPDLRLPDRKGRTVVQYAREANLTTIQDIFQSHATQPCSRHRIQHLVKRVQTKQEGKTCPRGKRQYLEEGPSYSWWLRETRAGDSLSIPCPSGTNGTATWTCRLDGTWDRTPILSQCQAVIFGGWEEAMKAGENITAAEILSDVARNLHNITLAPGDLLTLAHIMEGLRDKHIEDLDRSPTLRKARNLAQVYMVGMMITVNKMLSGPEVWWGLPQEQRAPSSTQLQTSLTSAAVSLAHLQKAPIREFTQDKLQVQVIQQPPAFFSDVEGRRYTHPHYNLTSLTFPEGFHQGYVEHLTSIKLVFLSYTNLHCISNILPCAPEKVQAERHLPAKAQVNSAVIGANVGGIETWHAALGEVVEVRLQHVYSGDKFELGPPTCVWWDTRINTWATDGCHVGHTHPTYTLCLCDHLTNLAVIMDVNGILDTTDVLYYVMRCVTIVGCVVSIVSLAVSVVCFLAFKAVRRRASSMVHANLCLCLLGSELLVLGGLDATHLPLICTIVAALLHYLFLATFTWSAIEAFHMYLSFVKVWRTGSGQVKYYLCVGYLVPLVYVSITLALTHTVGYGTPQACWLAPRGLIWTFAAPIAVILLMNVAAFIMTMRVAWFKKPPNVSNRSEKKPGDVKRLDRRLGDTKWLDRRPDPAKWLDRRPGPAKWLDRRPGDTKWLDGRIGYPQWLERRLGDTKQREKELGDTKSLENRSEDTKSLENRSEDTKSLENRSEGTKSLENRSEDDKSLSRLGDSKTLKNGSEDNKESEEQSEDPESCEKQIGPNKQIEKRPVDSKHSKNRPQDTNQRAGLSKRFWSSLSILLLLCLTWLTGFLYFAKGTHVMAVMFTLINSLQGIGIFVLHVVRNEHIVSEVKGVFK